MNKRLAKAHDEHNRWLAKRGLLPSQIKARKGPPKILGTWDAKPMPKPNENITFTAGLNSIWEKIRKGEEKQETIDAIVAKSKRIAALYNKGPIQYITDDRETIRNLGKKSSF